MQNDFALIGNSGLAVGEIVCKINRSEGRGSRGHSVAPGDLPGSQIKLAFEHFTFRELNRDPTPPGVIAEGFRAGSSAIQQRLQPAPTPGQIHGLLGHPRAQVTEPSRPSQNVVDRFAPHPIGQFNGENVTPLRVLVGLGLPLSIHLVAPLGQATGSVVLKNRIAAVGALDFCNFSVASISKTHFPELRGWDFGVGYPRHFNREKISILIKASFPDSRAAWVKRHALVWALDEIPHLVENSMNHRRPANHVLGVTVLPVVIVPSRRTAGLGQEAEHSLLVVGEPVKIFRAGSDAEQMAATVIASLFDETQ